MFIIFGCFVFFLDLSTHLHQCQWEKGKKKNNFDPHPQVFKVITVLVLCCLVAGQNSSFFYWVNWLYLRWFEQPQLNLQSADLLTALPCLRKCDAFDWQWHEANQPFLCLDTFPPKLQNKQIQDLQLHWCYMQTRWVNNIWLHSCQSWHRYWTTCFLHGIYHLSSARGKAQRTMCLRPCVMCGQLPHTYTEFGSLPFITDAATTVM